MDKNLRKIDDVTNFLLNNKLKKSNIEELHHILDNMDETINILHKESHYDKYLSIINDLSGIEKQQIHNFVDEESYKQRIIEDISNFGNLDNIITELNKSIQTVRNNVNYLKSIPNYEDNKEIYEELNMVSNDVRDIVSNNGVVHLSQLTFNELSTYFFNFKNDDAKDEPKDFYSYLEEERRLSENREFQKAIFAKYNIKYNPYDAYDRGYSFVHQFDNNTDNLNKLKEAIDNIEYMSNLVKDLPGGIEYSTRLVSSEELLNMSKEFPVIVFKPNSQDIITAFHKDTYTGSSTTGLFGKGSSQTKAPINKEDFDLSIADVINNTTHGLNNKVIIIKNKGNYRLLYSGDGANFIKLTNEYNAKLDKLYGNEDSHLLPN